MIKTKAFILMTILTATLMSGARSADNQGEYEKTLDRNCSDLGGYLKATERAFICVMPDDEDGDGCNEDMIVACISEGEI